MKVLAWQERSACLTEDPVMFFPVGTSAAAMRQAEYAKWVCRGCEVRETCLEWALATRQDDGVLGGLTEQERATLRRRRYREAAEARAVRAAEEKLAAELAEGLPVQREGGE